MRKILFIGLSAAVCYLNYCYAEEKIDVEEKIDEVFSLEDCTKISPTKKLRYGHSYTFYDEIENVGGSPLKIKDVTVSFSQGSNYGSRPSFSFTQEIKDKNGVISPGDDSVKYVSSEEYNIIRVPREYRNYHILIKYIHKYIDYVDEKEIGDLKNYTSCVGYQISWCGNGRVDHDFGEQCDIGDTENKEGWGNLGCSTECKRIDLN